MEKLHWTVEEVIGFVEGRILDKIADDKEIEMYEDYIWNGELNRDKYLHTYKKVLRRMRYFYEN